MSKSIKICKVCGAEYEYCHTITDDKFRWQDVACCKEHAAKYFDMIAASRGEKVTKKSKSKTKAKATYTPVVMEEPVEVENSGIENTVEVSVQTEI